MSDCQQMQRRLDATQLQPTLKVAFHPTQRLLDWSDLTLALRSGNMGWTLQASVSFSWEPPPVEKIAFIPAAGRLQGREASGRAGVAVMITWTQLWDHVSLTKKKEHCRVAGSWRSRSYVVSEDRWRCWTSSSAAVLCFSSKFCSRVKKTFLLRNTSYLCLGVTWCYWPVLLFGPNRSSERESSFLTPALGKEMPFLATALVPALSSTPAAALLASDTSSADYAPQSSVSIRKRRRLAASPGGLHWTSTGEKRLLIANGKSQVLPWPAMGSTAVLAMLVSYKD